jgi:hypothetical protein
VDNKYWELQKQTDWLAGTNVTFTHWHTSTTEYTIIQICRALCYAHVPYTNNMLYHFCAQEKLSDSFRQASAKIGATIGLRVNEEDGTITPVPPVQIELPDVHGTITKSQSTWTIKIYENTEETAQ